MPQDLPRVFVKSIYEMIDAFMSSRPNFEPSHSQDFMDPNNNVFNPKFTYQEFETAVAQDPSSPMMHDDLTPLDLIPYLYNYSKPRYTVFNASKALLLLLGRSMMQQKIKQHQIK
jgi:hypothetical protein